MIRTTSYLRQNFNCDAVCAGTLPGFNTAAPTAIGDTPAPTPHVGTPTAHESAAPTSAFDPAPGRPVVLATVVLQGITKAEFDDGGAPRKQFILLLAQQMSVDTNAVVIRGEAEARRRRLLEGSVSVSFAVYGNAFTGADHVRALLDVYLQDTTLHGFTYQVSASCTTTTTVTFHANPSHSLTRSFPLPYLVGFALAAPPWLWLCSLSSSARCWERRANTLSSPSSLRRTSKVCFIYRYISCESCSQFDLLPLTYLWSRDLPSLRRTSKVARRQARRPTR